MKHGSLFSGIGGFDLAAAWCGWQNIWQVEIDPYCRAVLQKHFPDTKRYEDIKNVKGLEAVDVISGGFPCQPFSVAGKQAGKGDSRYLWPEMLRVITEVKPAWVVAENVAGIINMELESVLASLEAEGYEVWPIVIPACAVGAPHRRDRVWILAHSSRIGWRRRSNGNEGGSERALQATGPCYESAHVADSYVTRLEGSKCGSEVGLLSPDECGISFRTEQNKEHFATEPDVGRVAHGILGRVDRLKSLGNAIVPQVAYQIFKAIEEIERQNV